MRDDDVRSSCFNALSVLRAQFGDDIPYAGGLDRGFAFRGSRVPFLNRQQGIFRAAIQRGPAALSIQTSANSPYGDRVTPEGIVYAYRGIDAEHRDNRALRAAYELRVPIVYFVATRPGSYSVLCPSFVVADDRESLTVLIQPGVMRGPLDDQQPAIVEDPIERRYVVRRANVRVHQARFRGRVLPAYRDRCAICSLRELRLLDAAHIVGDLEEGGEPEVSNGLSLCSIHHRAFDHHLVGVDPDYRVHVSRRLLEEDDGPMLDVLKTSDGAALAVPGRAVWRPDRERLAVRYDRFLERSA